MFGDGGVTFGADVGFSTDTQKLVPNVQLWITNEYTNEYEHDGLRQDARVLERLMDMVSPSAAPS